MTSSAVSSAQPAPKRPAWLWLALAGILILYAISLVRLHPTNLFGLTEDDSIYFSSAKALANGWGYVLPDVPGSPPATKYPEAYPLLLAHVWQMHPLFPENLHAAINVNAILGCAFVALMLAFFCNSKDLSSAAAALLTAFCALHPLLIFYSGSVLSEVPFCAVVLGSLLLADREIRANGRIGGAIACGLLAGCSLWLRVFGVMIVAGILLTGLARRAKRQTLIFCVSTVPFFAALGWQQLKAHAAVRTGPVLAGAVNEGWVRTYAYYTNYVGFWKLSVPNAHVFWAMLKNNFVTLLQAPCDFLLYPLFSRTDAVGIAVVTVIAAVTFSGMRRQVVRNGWKPIHSAFACYLPVILLWNYPDSTHRFLLPFLCLLIGGFWTEIRHLFQMIVRTSRAGKSLGDKLVAAGFGCVLVLFCGCILWNYAGGMRTLIQDKSRERATLLQSKREAYRWLAASTQPDDRLIAWEDGVAYLYTGRSAMRPIVFTTAELYETQRVDEAVKHLTDVAKTIHASYWIFADDDFQGEFPEGTAAARRELARLETTLPLAFSSDDGRVRVRSLACLTAAQPSCKPTTSAASGGG